MLYLWLYVSVDESYNNEFFARLNAMEVLIKYCTNSFLKLINSFDRKLINFLLLLNEPIRFRFRTDWPIGNAQEVKINLNSYELINLRKWIHAIFYQHFHCIDSNIQSTLMQLLFSTDGDINQLTSRSRCPQSSESDGSYFY
jgi:hypothetical protein